MDYLKAFAQAHEAAGFDRALIGYDSTQPDGLHLGTYVSAVTEKLGVMLAHRPGFVAWTLAARTLATIDNLSRDRASVHIISGADDTEQRRDGDLRPGCSRPQTRVTGWTSGYDRRGAYHRRAGGGCAAGLL